MPGCVFSAIGDQFNVDAFIKDSPWREFASIFRKGEPTRPATEVTGLCLRISDSDEDKLEQQIQDSMEFLQEDRAEIERLRAFPGVESLELRIGLFWWRDTLCRFYTLPPDIMRCAGELGVAVTLCVYGASGNEPP